MAHSANRRHEAQEEITARIAARLDLKKGNGGTLEGIDHVIRGDEYDEEPPGNILWVDDGRSRAAVGPGGSTIKPSDTIQMDFAITAQVTAQTAQKGQKQASMLSRKAGEEAMRDENGSLSFRLGLGYVTNMEYVEDDRQAPVGAENVYGHTTLIRVTFKSDR